MYLLRKDIIQRIEDWNDEYSIKVVFLNLELNIHFDPQTFQIINFQSLKNHDIQFWSQALFTLFFGPWFEREEIKWSNSGGKKKKVLVETDFDHKKSNFSVNDFILMGESLS